MYYPWKDWVKLRKTSVRIASVLAKIWTEYLPSMGQECYHYVNLSSIMDTDLWGMRNYSTRDLDW
jgi:hypothetical protein